MRPTRLAVAVLIGAAAIVGVLILSRGEGDSTPRPHAERARPSSAPSWQAFHGVRLPLSESDGPRHLDGDLAAGFARTEQGALLAALHIAVRANAQWGPSVFEPTIERQVVGPDKQALLDATRRLYEQSRIEAGLPDGAPLGEAFVVYEAYRWESFTPQAATVDIVSAGPNTTGGTVRASTRIQVRWHDGDWRVVAPLGGDWGNTAVQVKSLDGYTRLDTGSRG
jgi:hypothetical protein